DGGIVLGLHLLFALALHRRRNLALEHARDGSVAGGALEAKDRVLRGSYLGGIRSPALPVSVAFLVSETGERFGHGAPLSRTFYAVHASLRLNELVKKSPRGFALARWYRRPIVGQRPNRTQNSGLSSGRGPSALAASDPCGVPALARQSGNSG